MPLLFLREPHRQKPHSIGKMAPPTAHASSSQTTRNISVDKAFELIQAGDDDSSDVGSRDSPDGWISSDEEGSEGRTEQVDVEKSCKIGTSKCSNNIVRFLSSL